MRLGGAATFWGRVGDDSLGRRIIDDLAAEGVNVDNVRRIAGCRSPSTVVLIDDSGERLVCTYNDPKLDPDRSWLPPDNVLRFDAVLADARWPEGAAAVLDRARTLGKPAVFDGDIASRDILLDLAARATHAIFSERGLAVAAQTEDPGPGVERLGKSLPGVVGVTLGSDGFAWREGAVERRAPPYSVHVLDTLAAGDIWHGAFTLALAEGSDIARSAGFANVAAAIKCGRFGGRRGAPSRWRYTR